LREQQPEQKAKRLALEELCEAQAIEKETGEEIEGSQEPAE